MSVGKLYDVGGFMLTPQQATDLHRQLGEALAVDRGTQLGDALADLRAAIDERDRAQAEATSLRAEVAKFAASVDYWREHAAEITREINTPHTEDFLYAVMVEAAHQRQRWGTEHDAGKTDADWFWLVGYLAGKAIHPGTDLEKKLHRIIAAAAALLNWHAHASGADTRMRPGIEPPAAEVAP